MNAATLDLAVELVDSGACSAVCLFGREPVCVCRCGGEHHGLLREPKPRKREQQHYRNRDMRDVCTCGLPFIPAYFANSGSTRVRAACPEWIAEQRRSDWYERVPGHEYVVETTPEHAATGCCDIRRVET